MTEKWKLTKNKAYKLQEPEFSPSVKIHQMLFNSLPKICKRFQSHTLEARLELILWSNLNWTAQAARHVEAECELEWQGGFTESQ